MVQGSGLVLLIEYLAGRPKNGCIRHIVLVALKSLNGDKRRKAPEGRFLQEQSSKR
jgi:hypothetical protein